MNADKVIEDMRAQIESGKLAVDPAPIEGAGDAAVFVEELNAAKQDAGLNWRPDWLMIKARAESHDDAADEPAHADPKSIRRHLEFSARAYFIEQAVEMGVPTSIAAAASRSVRLHES